MTRRSLKGSARGYHGVAVWHPKHESNVGTLWRSAFLYDAAFIATIGRRYAHQASDTPNTPQKIPLIHYDDIDDLIKHLPHGCPLVGVELDDRAVPLSRFWHPENALYLLGAEDHGLPQNVLARCHHVVQVESPKEWSMNVSTAGTTVLYSRYLQGLK